MSERINKNNQFDEKSAEGGQLTPGRSLTPPAFNLTAGSSQPPATNNGQPIQAKSDETQTDEGEAMFEATQMLKFLDHLDVIMDLKAALSPSLMKAASKVISIMKFVDSLSDARKGASLSPVDYLKDPGAIGALGRNSVSALKSLGFAFKSIEMTYWATTKGTKALARGVYAAQEFAGQITYEQYENAVENLEDSVPESIWGLFLMPSETYQNLRKIKRLSKSILDEFSALKIAKRSLQNGDKSMSDVFSTLTDLKAYLADFLELCEKVQEVLGDLGFDVDLSPVEKTIDKLSYPLKSMKQLIREDQSKRKGGDDEAQEGGWPALKKSLEPGYKPALDPFFD